MLGVRIDATAELEQESYYSTANFSTIASETGDMLLLRRKQMQPMSKSVEKRLNAYHLLCCLRAGGEPDISKFTPDVAALARRYFDAALKAKLAMEEIERAAFKIEAANIAMLKEFRRNGADTPNLSIPATMTEPPKSSTSPIE